MSQQQMFLRSSEFKYGTCKHQTDGKEGKLIGRMQETDCKKE